MRPLFLAAVVLALCGCTKPLVFDKPDVSQQAFAADRYDCMQQSASAGNYSAFGPPLFVAAAAGAAQKRQRNMMVACMEARGYVTQR